MTFTFRHLLAATLMTVGILSGLLAGFPDEQAARATEIEMLRASTDG